MERCDSCVASCSILCTNSCHQFCTDSCRGVCTTSCTGTSRVDPRVMKLREAIGVRIEDKKEGKQNE